MENTSILEQKIKDLQIKSNQVHEKAMEIFSQEKVPGMLKNEFRNKMNQYDSMYDSVETMKALSSKPETTENLLNQQVEILTVRIKWELDWTKRAILSLQ